MDKGIVALGPTHDDPRTLGACFTRAFPVDKVPCFGALLSAIDDADRELSGKRMKLRIGLSNHAALECLLPPIPDLR